MTGEVTLDFCGGKYPSESLRTARYQVEYDKRGDTFSASNEVVAYKPGGAKRGNILSAVYGFGPSASVVQAKTLKLAEQSAANLKKNVAPSNALVA